MPRRAHRRAMEARPLPAIACVVLVLTTIGLESVRCQLLGLPQLTQTLLPGLGALPRPPATPAAAVAPVQNLASTLTQLPGLAQLPGAQQLPTVPGAQQLPTVPGAQQLPTAPAANPAGLLPSLPTPLAVPRVTLPAPAGTGQQPSTLRLMTNTLRQLNQQLTNIRNQLSTVGGLTPSGVSLLQFRTTPAIIRQGIQAVRNLQQVAASLGQGQQLPVSELIYPSAIRTVLNGASAQPTDSRTGQTSRIACATTRPTSCGRGPYRTMDGTCNNEAQPLWGSAGTPLIRIHRSTYPDGILQPRTAGVGGTPLPSARLISARCTRVREGVDSRTHTLSVMQWGQFLDHDITHVPVQRSNATTGLDCCTRGVPRDVVRRLPECFPIEVAANDPFYARHGVRCLNFLRSIPALGRSCVNEPAQQLNQITHWIDGSNVYGSDLAGLAQLRRGRSRRLRLSRDGRLPRLPHGAEGCVENAGNGICYRAGDSRVNEQISLTLMHNIWAIMHNHIADRLKRLNPAASEEDLFQEARALNVALMQKITYEEWLPIVLGPSLVRRLRLDRPARYMPALHPGIINEFSAAAFRFGHSLVSGVVKVAGGSRPVRLSDVFFSPGARLQERGMRLAVARSLVQQPGQAMDTTFSGEIVGKLFRGRHKHGLDLVALNIQRGRDHGITTYVQARTALRAACPGLAAPVSTWRQLAAGMSARAVSRLRSVYRSVEDIDLYVAGVAENRAAEGILGPTFQCILAEQFARLKYADRHFYNHVGSMFSRAQLAEIQATTWSSVLCHTFPALRTVPRNGFLRSG
ncbi:chorion peroxidase-like [Pollicipes pollicipes]|uniref:chorion peroxidase-like n=1 Tax=Pollicipes pollicipes TaxID=41117 RepID=UPI001884B9DB|nr:chorion peroxidase-like [Pollicipes pollicipes]